MNNIPLYVLSAILAPALLLAATTRHERDVVKTTMGDLTITFLGHASMIFQCNGKVFHIDPVGKYADYATLPKADVILVTHQHFDHCDPNAIAAIRTAQTTIILNEAAAASVPNATVMKNGDTRGILGVTIEAIPAYNLVHMREDGKPFHPKGEGNGYILTFGKTRIYIAGDTENTPEMKALKDIDIAFLPMNLPYTMTPAMVADAAKTFRPRILYPYHFGETNTQELQKLLQGEKEIEVRVRAMR